MGLFVGGKSFDCHTGRRRLVLRWLGVVALTNALSWTPAVASPMTWRVQMFAKGQENWLSIEGADLYADFSQTDAWTLRNLRYRGVEIIGIHGANGSVVNVVRPAGGEANPWIGTSHGKEKVASFTITIDGQRVDYQTGRTYSGSQVVLVKRSNLGPLDHQAEIRFPASGDRIVEKNSYTPVKDSLDRLNFLYAFMHCNNNRLNQWLALLPDGEMLQGKVVRDDNAFSLTRDVRAVALYDDQDQVGVAYVYPEAYPGVEGFRNAIWDRKLDNKLYFRPALPQEAWEAGKHVEFQLEVIPFSAGPNDWVARAQRITSG
jgi:hypothetical protein